MQVCLKAFSRHTFLVLKIPYKKRDWDYLFIGARLTF